MNSARRIEDYHFHYVVMYIRKVEEKSDKKWPSLLSHEAEEKIFGVEFRIWAEFD